MKLNDKGILLYESLVAFMLFIGVVVLLVSLFRSLNIGRLNINRHYTSIMKKEESILKKEEFIDVIEMVLH